MQKSLRQNSILFSFLGIGLLYCSLVLNMIGIALRRAGEPGGDIPAALAHFALALLVSLVLCRVFRPEGPAIFSQRTERFLLPLLILAGLACIAVALFPDKLFSLRYCLLHPALGLFMPLGFTLFLQLSPAGKEGVLFGLLIAFCEFLWFVLFPLVYGPLTSPTREEELLQFFSIHWAVLGITLCCLGVACFAAVRRWRHSGIATPKEQSGSIHAAVVWLFGATLGMSVLLGLATGKFLPKLGYMPRTTSPLYFLLLALFPLAGLALDRGKGLAKLALPIMAACLCIPLLDAAVNFALLDSGVLFVYANAIKILLFMGVWVATARLLKTHRLFPLLITLVYSLHLAQIFGAALRDFAPAYAYSALAAFLIAGAAAFCLWRFRALLLKNPGLWDLPTKAQAAEASPQISPEASPETSPEALPEAAREKLAAFSFVFDLTKREEEILDSLLSGLNPSEIAQKYQIAENTVRRHLTSLIRKAQTRSSRRLLTLYAAWTPPEELR